MNYKNSILRGWELLKSKDSDEHGMRFIKLIGDDTLLIEVGIIYPLRSNTIIFSFNNCNDNISIPEISLEGFSLGKFEHPDKLKFNLSMKLIQQDEKQSEIFISICDDLVSYSQKYKKQPAEIKLKKLIERIFSWVEFLKNKSNKILSMREQLGLIAELLVFERLIQASLNIEDVITSWVGPEKKPKDYEKQSNAIEVKCKLASEGAIKISNLKQLDNYNLDELKLCVVSLSEDTTSTMTLNSIILRITKLILNLDMLKIFFHKLHLVGYHFKDREKYETTFITVAFDVYLVEDDFPRLVQSNIDVGVTNVKYSLDINSVAKFKIAEEHLTEGWK